jgi:hypothetical protein
MEMYYFSTSTRLLTYQVPEFCNSFLGSGCTRHKVSIRTEALVSKSRFILSFERSVSTVENGKHDISMVNATYILRVLQANVTGTSCGRILSLKFAIGCTVCTVCTVCIVCTV